MFFEKPSCLLNLIGGIIVLEKIKGQDAELPLVMMIHSVFEGNQNLLAPQEWRRLRRD
jgi:hypothetical protein